MNFLRSVGRLSTAWLLLIVLPVMAAPNSGFGKIELMRDTWGIPHDFSNTDAGAMYGLGYATADQRGFQKITVERVLLRR
jgi:acyl-homoserine lactone acylase PvdQ